MRKADGTYDRAVPFATTMQLVSELRRRYGITRVAETTHLDRIGIPTYSTMVPRSPDMLGVYNGKGVTNEAAIVSAVMEAAERQIGANVQLPRFRKAVKEIEERIDLVSLGMRSEARDLTVDCVLGTDLITSDQVAVPLAMVQCPWLGDALFPVVSTNGLASGNNLVEATYHALCELVERHAWSLYHTRSSQIPRIFGAKGDMAIAPQIAMPTDDAVVDTLVKKIEDAGLVVRALALRDGDLPIVCVASINELRSDPPMAHMGLGCSLSPAHALTRALTEAAQSRATDIQAAREDILRPDDDAGMMAEHGRRPREHPKNAWYLDIATDLIPFSSLVDRASNDLETDLRVTIEALRNAGAQRVIIVDLSPADLPISVVRAIVPGLETFIFSGHLGPRARAWLNPFTVTS